ncbi:hypothetical protein BpHYR1_053119 [Brachionus plicatilis]|uniref:Uncharacterized protein n=1 Tax=Brachionus plicatilis TaxID=10195 RepID=A0A3M7S8K6_BRAPC|nr:hypothetical protein BpHYR1_053119 [Brachionus plicatilis]
MFQWFAIRLSKFWMILGYKRNFIRIYAIMQKKLVFLEKIHVSSKLVHFLENQITPDGEPKLREILYVQTKWNYIHGMLKTASCKTDQNFDFIKGDENRTKLHSNTFILLLNLHKPV